MALAKLHHNSLKGGGSSSVQTRRTSRCLAGNVYAAANSQPLPKAGAVQPSSRPQKLHTKALKEWAVIIGALGSGDQTVIFRKGGIREPTFKPEAREFLLFPTAFHSDQQLLKPGVAEKFAEELKCEPKDAKQLPLPCYAQLTGAWTTKDPTVLSALDPLHVCTPEFLETRLKWRGAQPISVLELRVWRLGPSPLQLQVNPDFFGCFSWVDLTSGLPPSSALDLSLAQATPALTEDAFVAKQRDLRARLQQMQHEELELPGL